MLRSGRCFFKMAPNETSPRINSSSLYLLSDSNFDIEVFLLMILNVYFKNKYFFCNKSFFHYNVNVLKSRKNKNSINLYGILQQLTTKYL